MECKVIFEPRGSFKNFSTFFALSLVFTTWLNIGCSENTSNYGDADADTDTDTDTETDLVVQDGDFSLSISLPSKSIAIEKGDTELLRFGADGIQLGKVRRVEDDVSYDPWPMKASPDELIGEYTPPKGLEWLDLTDMTVLESHDRQAKLALVFEKGVEAELDIESKELGGVFSLNLVPVKGYENIAYYRLRPRCDREEGLYGMGSHLDQVNHRGKVRAMQLEIDKSVESGYNEVHVPVPLLIGTTGWGLFVQSPYPGVFGVADKEDDLIDVIYGTGTATKEGLTFHLMAANHPLDITKLYYEITGYPRLPAPWALGPWVWRDEVTGQAQVESDLEKMRELDLACSAYWIDRPYATGVNSFDFDRNMFNDPQAMIEKAHALGYRMALWHTPYLEKNEPSTAELRRHAEDNGFFPPEYTITSKWGAPIDFTNPEAYSWWQDLVRRYTSMGIEGFKLDYAEDVQVGLPGARNPWLFYDGSDERTMHALYQLLYHRVYAETLPEDGGFLLCRAGMYGDQVNGPIIWPGDLDATMTERGEPFVAPDGKEVQAGVGGLPASLIYGLSLGPSGFPFYGSDTGGYRNSPPDKETFTRWFEQTSLSSVMQIGTSTNDVAWEFKEENGFDQEMLDWYKTYVRLHLRLWPYEWTLANNLLKDGRPIQRPFGLQFPETGEHPDYQYMFGDDLLVAPVVKRGAREKVVVFPPGAWIDWWNGEEHGQGTETVQAPLGKLPLFLRKGGMIPMLRPTIDTLAATTEPEKVDSFATDPGILYTRVGAGGQGSFTVYDGTKLSQKSKDGTITLSCEPGSVFVHGFWLELMGLSGDKPSSVKEGNGTIHEVSSIESLESADSGFYWEDQRGGVLHIKLGDGVHVITVIP